ncbi:MAG: acetate--CoA ligase [Nitrososphaerota archaeon]|jgi:acetyl-CoA synthetase|nr:acetate--CoA ligase [Nitrososphaerota archaeon]MDG6941614.1 acetate--CoA ligase [Nitrososphaerota archaeon]MDG6947210.1 acetate--CoA ligase [Nitrososphaerota archaeon]MDG6951210.1 acetate--CoA ligase [Nitrososphaerota archaeon]
MTDTQPDATERHIAVHWKEEPLLDPPESFVAQANLKDRGVFERFSEKNFPECFRDYADLLTWDEGWHKILDSSNPPFWKWFVGGRLNAAYNCVDRHLPRYGNKAAIIWVPEPESEPHRVVTYQELYRSVNEFALLLQHLGVRAGDRVTFHLPMVPELPISMLACARLGVIHNQVFGGFSARACAERVDDSKSSILVTIDGYYRNGGLIDKKAEADVVVKEAAALGTKVERVLVWRRHSGRYISNAPMVEGRDFFVDELLMPFRGKTIAPVSMDSEAPLFLMYTSGSTGRPKGVQHRTGGYLAYVAATSKYVQDIHPEDVYWCFADIGWITGHSYIVYGPLALAATTVMYEGVPLYPDAGRPWRIAERLGVNIFHTAPTTIRMLRKSGPREPGKYDFHFKAMTTVGEPIEPETWKWFHEVVGKNEAVITDTWWQTETGGFLCSTLPALNPMKPGSAGPGLPGIYPVILDEEGAAIPPGENRAGNLCIRNPWPGIMQTIWGDPDRFVRTYYAKFNKDKGSKDWRDWPYFAGDGAVLASDGYFRILGRVDDVIKVAGHRLGTKELENAVLTIPDVAEAAAIAMSDELRGHVPVVYVALKPGSSHTSGIEDAIKGRVVEQLGPIARPRFVYVVPDLPKTRSGKIMRRVLVAISDRKDPGDTTTLANPDIVVAIKKLVQSD